MNVRPRFFMPPTTQKRRDARSDGADLLSKAIHLADPHRALLMPFFSKFQARLEELKKRL